MTGIEEVAAISAASSAAASSTAALTAGESAFLTAAGASSAATAGIGSTIASAAQIAALAGTALSTVGAINQGIGARRLGKFQAAQLNQQAGQSAAAAQRSSLAQAYQANLAKSKIRSIAGGSSADPSVVDIMGDVQGEGEYNALTALYNGNERSSSEIAQADSADLSGNQSEQAGYATGAATAVKGVMSLMNKYSPT